MSAYIITGIFTVGYLIMTVFLCRGIKLPIKAQALCGLACAMTVVLSFIYIPLPTGASISIGALIPIMLLSVCYDYRIAILSGAITAILALFLLPIWAPVHWAQFFVEHLVCFSCLGYAGIFGCDKKWKMLCGIAIAILIKTTGHVLSGILFFSQNAWEGFGAVAYSFGYNLSSLIPEAILAAILMLALPIQNIRKIVNRGNVL